MSGKTVDMTKGPILRQMSTFALPVLLGMLCQRVYNFADVYIVGKYLGDQALAAVSISGVVMYLLFSLMMGLTTGVNVVISQYYGSGNQQKVKATFTSSAFVAFGFALLITIVGVLTAVPTLKLMQTSEELLEAATSYLMIIYLGGTSTMLYNWIAAVLRSLGNSFVPFIFLIISSVLNIFLDIVFLAWIPLGTAGAALATVLAQLFSGIACCLYAWRLFPFLKPERGMFQCDREIAKQILIYGVPTGFQMSIISISDMTLQAVVNTYGTAMIVAYGVCTKVEGLGFQIADAIGSALGTFAGQNVGAKQFDRVRKGVTSAYVMNIVCYGIFCPIVFFTADKIMRQFTGNTDAICYGTEYMKMFSLFFIAGGVLVIYHNILRASGDIPVTLLMGLSEVVTRIGCAMLLPKWFGHFGLWLVSPFTWVCAALVGAVRYYSGAWQKKAEKMLLHREEVL